ncbi:beta-ketoacyl-[acyl-carrier-protein] synthase family protein [Pseudoglutamicibacter cumminsii]|uniref:beta-ketoacyl-[acyl-carrier-protein] synthase family protein n=1 Tax=Pseudoglutamicibacter cumminsii TaxID=156979 RepID=UPI002553989D|nr:beta-ketoacyl-[acyl-carrier-protein] synthase family protein [Pseudoglutamicibacter cumminsii]MDZ3744567.1 beta-ketoacyl-[acyl-carrier-protein] synthase family protein [Pseudoglutamicibacter cumminsii]
MTHEKVTITGLGAITPSGLTVPEVWDAVVNGRSGIRVLEGEEFETSHARELAVCIGGQVRGFNREDYVDRQLARRLEDMHVWAIAAADQALAQAGIHLPGATEPNAALPWDPSRVMVVVATGSGPLRPHHQAALAFEQRGQRGVPLSLTMHGAPDAPAALISQRYGVTGPARAVSATCASGAVALGEAMRALRHGYADAAIVVGVEDCVNPINVSSNANVRALAAGYEANPEQASRPFDRGRKGFVVTAGAAAVVLERETVAQSRGAHALAELAGYGASSDAHHPTAPLPDGRGAAAAMRAALADAGLTPEQFAMGAPDGGAIGHVNAHGTGTMAGDAAEAAALKAVFGASVEAPTANAQLQLPITATKSSTGHLLGAAGVLEAVISVCSLREGIIPPTINLEDPAFPELNIVREPRCVAPESNTAVLSNSFGFGGHNAAILITAGQ